MRGIRSVLFGLLAVVLTASATRANDAVLFSYGPTIPYTVVRFDPSGKAKADVLATGAGFSLNFNLRPTPDGRWRLLTFGVPLFMSHDQATDFAFSAGASIGTLNNLLSLGAVYDLINVGADGLPDSGLFTGETGKQNLRILFGLNFNLGSGAPESASPGARKAGAHGQSTSRPPGYIAW